jgi:hypothetical protein
MTTSPSRDLSATNPRTARLSGIETYGTIGNVICEGIAGEQ